jgi:hypothetical protein
MSFTGKSTFTAGAALPELTEDVSDIISIVSPFETPVLDIIGDGAAHARSTYHEWLEDSLLSNTDTIAATSFVDPQSDTTFNVATPSRFSVGDQIRVGDCSELMLVTSISGSQLTLSRGYGGTDGESISVGDTVYILGGAAVEGADRPDAEYTSRIRRGNYTQIFTSSVEVSGSNLAASQIGLASEMDYQKQQRIRELIRDLENTVINGGQAQSNPQGTQSTPRTMKGIIRHISTNGYNADDAAVPGETTDLDEEKLNFMLKTIWQNSTGSVDTIIVNGTQKRRINQLLDASRMYGPDELRFRNVVNYYESDFGLCRVVLSRWVPADSILFVDSSRLSVIPLAGRSFHFKPLVSGGDYEAGQIIGEYTLEMRNEEAHGILRGLSTE